MTSFYAAEVETRNTYSHGFGSSPEEAVAALIECWRNEYAPHAGADPDYLASDEMREEMKVFEVVLGKGYVVGSTDHLGRNLVLTGDNARFDEIFEGVSPSP